MFSLSADVFFFFFVFGAEISDDEEEDEDLDGGCEESGLGLLARFAASALPVSSGPGSLLPEGKHCSRQSTLGKYNLLV